jgi:hypothetical protein
MKRLVTTGATLLLCLGAAPVTRACPECRAQVNSGVYGPDFITNLLAMLLPLIVLAIVGVGIYHAGDFMAKLRGRAGRWQNAQTARR